MNRKLIGLLASLLLAAAGTIVLVGYVRSAEARALQDERLVDVLVVADRIQSGTLGTEVTDDVRMQKIPAKVRAEGAVTDLAELSGLVADVDLLPGEQLVRQRFVAPSVAQRGDVPPGLHEVTISLDPARALGGRLTPGETVGVIGSFEAVNGAPVTHLILHKVLVTAVQTEPETARQREGDTKVDTVSPQGNLLVTVAVDAPGAERLIFIAEHGRVWLTSEPADAPVAGSDVQTYEKVLS